jgi:hypothetical protein
MVTMKKKTALLLVLFLTVSLLPAQEAETVSGSVPWKIMLFYRDESASPVEAESRLLYESLINTLRGVREDVFIVEAQPLPGPDTDDERSSLARRSACAGWMLVTLGGGEDLRVSYGLYNALSMEYAAQKSFTAPRPQIREITHLFWQETASEFLELPEREWNPSYRIHGLPGTRIRLNRKLRFRLNNEGVLELHLPLPATYGIRAEKFGWEPLEEAHLFLETGGDIQLEQKRNDRFALNFSLFDGMFPDFAFSYGIVPGHLFAEAGLTFFHTLFDLGPMANTNADNEFNSYPFYSILAQAMPSLFLVRPRQLPFYSSAKPAKVLVNFNFGLKWRFRQPDKLIRPYLGLGMAARIWFDPFIDPKVPYGLFPVLGMDSFITGKFRFFMELQPTFYYMTGSMPVDMSIWYIENYVGNLIPGLFVNNSEHWFFTGHFRIGVRWSMGR